MSTPTTATATLPHYNHFPYSHHHPHPAYPQPNTSPYRPGNPILPAASRLGYPSPASYPAPSSHGASNGISLLSSEAARPLPQEPTTLASRSETSYAAMPTVAQTQALPEPQPTRKRRRSREPDWSSFYRNGLPKEIIVIDDTPDPEGPGATSVSSQTLTNGHSNGIPTVSSTQGSARHLAKKRKRDDELAHYDPVHHNNIAASHTHTLRQHPSPSKSTVSTDRTSSAIHTTAATSLGSLSSNSQYDYSTQPGQKRKRTTRQQIANEARRREAQVVNIDPFASYRPPPYPPKKANEVHVKVITDHSHNRNVRVDDDDGHYIVVPDNDLTERYQMIKLLGQGTFGKVVQARDKRRNKLVAIKIIRSVQKYRDASKIELRVLATLKANDEENRNRCIHLRDCFDFRGHICIVMDLLGQSVFDFLKSNQFVPFPNSQIQNFARQLFTSVAFLHDLNLIHTDLKPENILLCHNDYQTFTYNRKIPSSSSTIARLATQRRVLLDTEIRLIDFGSATFQDEYHSSVVSTRHYRAPEIILGLGWSYPCDIWSIGCILVEFFTGDALFQTHDNLEHLAMMEAVVNARIDTSLVQQVGRVTRNGGNPASKYFKRTKLDYPTTETTRASRRFVKAMKRLDEIIPASNPFLESFLDLLKKIFVYDPNRRITAKGALQHPWFSEAAQQDDGTEAARIRAEKSGSVVSHLSASDGRGLRR
ncbi:kinase-like domain-containing protein [Lasiosphaeria miniovina]|uniref:dual-specificity kinase n=1 Tax=Lasiosphaeria miniovina TaxID=1954250 RepID=A0AA40AM75_9PEZI|nr:kinase-like domain-containing protein [Lasiosphaeria miniovina]KAK0718408.1 kinase-like domain-containing protein [Lasiosphaeria miniovina]